MIKAIVFDMDGVLIEAKDWHYQALNKALRLFGYEISRFDHLTTFDGLPTRKKLELLSLERDLPPELHSFINEMKQGYTTEIVIASCKPRFIHEYALSRLKTMGYRLGVASNSIRATVELMMQKAHLDGYLDVALSNQDVVNPKPHPEMYEMAASRLGVTPGECLVLEDNDHGIRAAVASGANVLVVREVTDVTLGNILAKIRDIDGILP